MSVVQADAADHAAIVRVVREDTGVVSKAIRKVGLALRVSGLTSVVASGVVAAVLHLLLLRMRETMGDGVTTL